MWSGQAVVCMWLGYVIGYGLECDKRLNNLMNGMYLFCGIKIVYYLCCILINQNNIFMKKKIRNYPLVEELYQDSDGWHAILIDGYNWNGCSEIHEYSLLRVWNALDDIQKGNPY
jgi:hypothetical protein